jgi:hypothetical protein
MGFLTCVSSHRSEGEKKAQGKCAAPHAGGVLSLSARLCAYVCVCVCECVCV